MPENASDISLVFLFMLREFDGDGGFPMGYAAVPSFYLTMIAVTLFPLAISTLIRLCSPHSIAALMLR
ncbi:MAG: hypothetical protein IPF44_05840 [Betaproteobacteria bacterium]|nr:hypothetical protein [Betaproteobacteria bacterium]